jgi:chemotaxis protein methyltransferase CheR
MTPKISPQVFSILSQLIEERTGLHYDARDSDLFAERVWARAAELEVESLLEYYYFLRYDEGGPRELDALVDHLVVSETYFYREVDQLRALVNVLLPPVLESKPAVRIWSAACATGEEPLTLAMMLAERGMLPSVEIVATDISGRALEKARKGVYGGRALRSLRDDDRARHFVPAGDPRDGTVRVREEVRSSVRWRRVNLLDPEGVESLGTFDVILCRNVLIYFRDETVMSLIQRCGDSLVPGGLLLVGASESLLRFGTLFACEEHGGAFFYRKMNK